MSKYRIAVVARWFGPLPCFFTAWLRSAEMNSNIDFYIFTDREVKSDKENIIIVSTTLKKETERAKTALQEEVKVCKPYKLVDLKPFIGLIYEEYLKGYDFWGYCDIDLAFGNIRTFLTDELLDQYERYYEWGHFSLFKNNDKMNHINDLPGGIYSRDEILRGNEVLFQDEDFGINRICAKNSIRWYKENDYAEFWTFYPDLVLPHGRQNYEHQVFYWEDGHAYRAGIDENGGVVTNEYIYIHWQGRKPVPDENALRQNAFYITTERFVTKKKGTPDAGSIRQMTPGLDDKIRRQLKRKYIASKVAEFFKAPWSRKKIWLRQKWMTLTERGTILEQD